MVAAPELAQPAATPLLSVSGLSARFGAVQALDGVSLTVRPGELIALAGENGAGKTTLVRCIAGDIAPSQGDIYISGRRVAPDPAAAARPPPPGRAWPWSGRTWPCARTSTSRPTCCSGASLAGCCSPTAGSTG